MAWLQNARHKALLAGALITLGSTAGCIDPFGGTHVTATFSEGVQTNGQVGSPTVAFQPPVNTLYQFVSVTDEFERDADGEVVLDTNGDPVIAAQHLFTLNQFEILPLINLASPCFIDLEGAPFPGVHVTRFYDKWREQTGIADPINPPADSPEYDVIDVLGARQRNANLIPLANTVRAVSTTSTYTYPPTTGDGQCVEDDPSVDPTIIPHPNCIGEQSNLNRLALCEAIWAENPDKYEGSDKVFALPLNGKWYGAVNAINPINSGFINGATFFIPEVIEDFDRLLLTWQYRDGDGDGEPDYPAGTAEEDKSPFGYLYMAGAPRHAARGVTNVSMVNNVSTALSAEIAIIPNLDNDSVHF